MELNADVLHVFKAFIQEISNAIIPQLFRQTILAILLSVFFSSYALTKQTSNIIHGNVPYLTFDDGCIRTVDTNDLNGIRYLMVLNIRLLPILHLQPPSFYLLQVRVLLCLIVSSMKVVEKI